MHILEIGAEKEDDGGNGRVVAEAAFRTVPRDHTTFLVWKVTENGVELLPRTHYGAFYDGDAYLVYSASLSGQPAGPDVIRREIKESSSGEYAERHVHAWAGGGGGGSLAAAALRRAAQLAAHLGAPSVLHREAAGHESPRLLSYFRDGIRILLRGPNGVGSTSARLYRVRGRRPVLLQLTPVSWAQLVPEGVFVLDAPALLVLWIGRTACRVEKIFGAKIAYRMARGADKGMTARRIAIAHDGYEQTLPSGERALLEEALQLRSRAARPTAPPPSPPRAARLYRAALAPAPRHAAAAHAAARLEEVKRAPLYREDLADDGVFIVDAGARGVWAWVGPHACGAVARGALAAARGLARARRHAGPVSAAPAGREPLEFAALFHEWRWADARRDVRLRAARSATTRLDAVSLAANAWLAAEAQLPDDGSGALRAWRVRAPAEGGEGGALVEVSRPQAAVFFDRDCYIALYTYHAPTGDHSILYYWMGGSSPNDLRNLGEKEAKDLYAKLGRLPIQAWVYQGKEPAHFLQIFKGRMITYVGSATDYDPSGGRVVAPSHALIRVSGQYAREARGVEVRAEGGQGRGACYVLREGGRAWVWCAATATGDEREVAKNMAPAEHTLVMQGKESEEFWAALGERRAWLAPAPPQSVPAPLPSRLFYVTRAPPPAHYFFEEMISFSQLELAPEMVALLDAHCAVFVWLGAHADPLTEPAHVAQHYLAHDPASRDPETPILVIRQGREPPNFTGFFPHWKHSMWKGHKTFSAIVSALEGKAIVQGGGSAALSGNTANRFDRHEKYPPSVLRGPRDTLPPDVDPLAKELYLSHDDFVATFSMPYSEFRSLPAWKQKDLKKAAGLF